MREQQGAGARDRERGHEAQSSAPSVPALLVRTLDTFTMPGAA
jgi:hypothetical protein